MFLSCIRISAIAVLSLQTSCATPEEWRSRSIYQVLTDRYARTDNNHSAKCIPSDRVYCGGTYRGLINNLDYIEDMGFSAVWISPITHNIEEVTGWGDAYHGYWQEDIYRLNDHFGTADDLKELSSELHRRGMYLMVDVVVNHFAWPGPANLINYTRFHPFNDTSYYHPYCEITNYDNQEMVEECWLGDANVELVDVKTEDPRVVLTYNSWISSLVSNYSIDGLRIDTAKHVRKSFWPGFSNAAGVFCTGEVLSNSPSYTCDYQNYIGSVINYPLYYPLTRAFTSTKGNMSELVDMHKTMQNSCMDTTLLLTFLSNHDTIRLAALSPSLVLRKNALVYTILSDGIPILYQGDEQGFAGTADPDNREAMWLSGFDRNAPLYVLIQKLNKLRAWAGQSDPSYWTSTSSIFWSDSQTLAIRKGSNGSQIVAILTNRGDGMLAETVKLTNIGFAAGTILVEAFGCEKAVVGNDGVLSVDMSGGDPKVFFPFSQFSGSLVCQPWFSRPETPRLLSLQNH